MHEAESSARAVARRVDDMGIQRRPQRQDSLLDQLRDLHVVAAYLGCYDAADWLWKRIREELRS
jgi:hypothetical protein